MNYSSQNLSDGKVSIFWNGRSWLRAKKREWNFEWSFGRLARGPSLKFNFGCDDSGSGIRFHICVPFVISLFISATGFWTWKDEWQTGFAVHNGGFWTYPMSYSDRSSSKDPWYRKMYCWDFPWTYQWFSTEILKPQFGMPFKTVYLENRSSRKTADWREEMDRKNAAKESVQETYNYAYTLKSGEVQKRKATIHVERMKWGMKWWPILPFTKTSTAIWVDFDGEVGEETGSWKGGTTGCGYEMMPFETPLETLRRMEREVKF